MTLLDRIRRALKPQCAVCATRPGRPDNWDEMITAAPVRRVVLQDRVVTWLEGRAQAYQFDAEHQDRPRPEPSHIGVDVRRSTRLTAEQRRAIADELRQCAIDFGATA